MEKSGANALDAGDASCEWKLRCGTGGAVRAEFRKTESGRGTSPEGFAGVFRAETSNSGRLRGCGSQASRPVRTRLLPIHYRGIAGRCRRDGSASVGKDYGVVRG